MLVQTDARRHAFNRFERPPTAGATHRADDRRVPAAHRGARTARGRRREPRARRHGDHHGSAHGRDSGAGQRADVRSERVSRGQRRAAPQPRRPGSLRARFDLQGRHGVGGDSGKADAGRHDDRHRPAARSRSARASCATRTTTASLSFTDVIVKSSNVGAIKIGFKLGTDRLSDYVQRFGFGRPVSPDFPSENPGIVWERVEVDRERAGVGVDGLPGRRDAAADGDGGQLGRQRRRVHRAARRPRGVSRRPSLRGPAEGRCGRRSVADTAAADDQHHGAGRRARHRRRRRRFPATPSPARPAPPTSWSTAATRTTRSRRLSDSCRRTIPAVTILVVLDSPHGSNGHFGGPCRRRSSSASPKQRCAISASRRRSIPAPPVLVAPRPTSARGADRCRRRSPAAGRPSPRTAGHRARRARPERARRDAQAGASSGSARACPATASSSSQDPAPGTPIDEGGVCRLTLERAPVRQTASAKQP